MGPSVARAVETVARYGRRSCDDFCSKTVNRIGTTRARGASLLLLRFVCCNGLVCGTVANDIRVPHKGNIQHDVIEGAFRVLQDFQLVDGSVEAMKALDLKQDEERALATAALALRFGEAGDGQRPAPVSVDQLTHVRRPEDAGSSLWNAFQRIQENAIRGGLEARTVNGRRMRTREVSSIDRGVSLNRALWVLAEEMRKLKAGSTIA